MANGWRYSNVHSDLGADRKLLRAKRATRPTNIWAVESYPDSKGEIDRVRDPEFRFTRRGQHTLHENWINKQRKGAARGRIIVNKAFDVKIR